MGSSENERDTEHDVNTYIQKMRDDAERRYELAREQLEIAAERRKRSYDMKVRKAEFSAGDWVWYWYPRRYLKRSPKWQQMYTGPYLITRFIAPVNYVLQKSAKSKPFVVHTDKLKKCFGLTPMSWLKSDKEHILLHDVEKCSPNVINTQNEFLSDIDITVNECQNKQKNLPNKVQCKYGHSKKPSHATTYIDQRSGVYSNETVKRPNRNDRRVPQHFNDFVL